MAVPVSLLDTILPLHDAREVHERLLPGEPAAVWAALHVTRMSEIRVAGALSALRALPRWASTGKLPRGGTDRPALEALLGAGFVRLEEAPQREIVIGAVGQFWRLTANQPLPLKDRVEFMQFTRPGYVRVAMSFRLVPEVGGTRLITETRVLGTDRASSRAFRRYWLVIRLGSGAIRRSWLAAVARRLAA